MFERLTDRARKATHSDQQDHEALSSQPSPVTHPRRFAGAVLDAAG